VIIKPNQALRIRATNNCRDNKGRERKAGEEWLVTDVGPYLPGPYEKLSPITNGHILDGETGVYVRVKNTFTDDKGLKQKAGTERLVTRKETEVFFPGVEEEVFQTVKLNHLTAIEYCIIKDPVNSKTGKNQLGAKELRKGPAQFFLLPGESIFEKKHTAQLIGPNYCLSLRAKEEHKDEQGVHRKPGDEWTVYGPMVYFPPMEVDIRGRYSAFISIWPLGIHIFSAFYLLLFIAGILYFIWKMVLRR